MKPFCCCLLLVTCSLGAAAQDINKLIDERADSVLAQVIEWRRALHQHPELSDQEIHTAEFVVQQLQELGMEIHTNVGGHGVVAILRGKKPGPVVAIRTDMDALPVTERGNLPFASHDTAELEGLTVGVMHACGHDAHMAMLLGTAKVLAQLRDRLPGTVVFLFQPDEEGTNADEPGGARRLIADGALDSPRVEAVFGLHIFSNIPVGDILYKSGPMMASSDLVSIHVKGKSSHGSQPWFSIDPIVVSAQIIMGLQTIVSRQENIFKAPVVVTIGSVHSGNRFNIIPESTDLIGTVRTLDSGMRVDVLQRIQRTATDIAAASGATADVAFQSKTLVTYNDSALTAEMLPALRRAAGAEHVHPTTGMMVSEDFSYYGLKAPTLFVFLGGMPAGADPAKVAFNHSPDFYIDDSRLDVGVKAFCHMVFDYAKLHPVR